MLRKNQQGFSHVLLFIVAIVLFAGLTIGFVLLKNNREDNSTAKKDTGAYVDDGQSVDDRDSGKKFMTISEWGVKLPITSETGTLYYTVVPFGESSTVEYARVYSTDIDELQNANGEFCSDDEFPIVTLAKTSQDKMYSVSDPDSADYAGLSGQFKSFDFDNAYAYSASGYYQSPPACSVLLPEEEGGESGSDDDVLRVYEKKKAAIIESFNKMQKE
jgi:hypothetical protein